MPRALRYYIEQTPDNHIDADAWRQIARLQHWYNSEFIWSCDKIGLKRYILFPNYEARPDMPYHVAKYHFRKRFLQKKIELGDEIEAVRAVADEGLFHVRWGGVRDDAIASGITHVAGNEFNAYLLCEFLLKCSVTALNATFTVEDEGEFILTKRAMMRGGEIIVDRADLNAGSGDDASPQIFSVVNPAKYDEYPRFVQSIDDLDSLDDDDLNIARKFGSFGFDAEYETRWGDSEGLNLQLRARKVVVPPARE